MSAATSGRPIRIGVDGRPFVTSGAGISRYVMEISRALARVTPEAEFVVFSQHEIDAALDDHFTIHVESNPIARRLNSFAWFKTRSRRLAMRHRIDVYWASATFVPLLPREVPVVSTVYDLAHLVAPDTMRTIKLWQHRCWFARDLRRAASIVALSQGTAARVAALLSLQVDAVAAPGVSSVFRAPPALEIERVRESYQLPPRYLLSVGTAEPRKNLGLLIDVFLELRAGSGLSDVVLAIAGAAGWKDARIKQALAAAPPGAIQRLGYVPDTDLPALYAGATAFVFPSRYEGFGLPVLEARACGAPVVCSDIAELREAGGPEALYVPPTSDGLRAGLVAALAGERALRGSASQPKPSWDTAAAALGDVLQRTAHPHGGPRSSL